MQRYTLRKEYYYGIMDKCYKIIKGQARARPRVNVGTSGGVRTRKWASWRLKNGRFLEP